MKSKNMKSEKDKVIDSGKLYVLLKIYVKWKMIYVINTVCGTQI